MCSYEMQGPGIPPLHSSGSLSVPNAAGTSASQAPESPAQGGLLLHPHLTSGRNLEIMWSKSHLVMRMIEMRIGQEPLLQVWARVLLLVFDTDLVTVKTREYESSLIEPSDDDDDD